MDSADALPEESATAQRVPAVVRRRHRAELGGLYVSVGGDHRFGEEPPKVVRGGGGRLSAGGVRPAVRGRRLLWRALHPGRPAADQPFAAREPAAPTAAHLTPLAAAPSAQL